MGSNISGPSICMSISCEFEFASWQNARLLMTAPIRSNSQARMLVCMYMRKRDLDLRHLSVLLSLEATTDVKSSKQQTYEVTI